MLSWKLLAAITLSYSLTAIAPLWAQVEECAEPATDIVSGTTITETIEVTDAITIEDITLHVEITHFWMGDIAIELTSPESTLVVCKTEADGDSNADMNLTFTDSGVEYGTELWSCDCEMQVAGPGRMADYANENSEGDWTLDVTDVIEPDDGVLDEWCVSITGCAGVDAVTIDCEVIDDEVTITFEGDGFEEFTINSNGEELTVLTDDDDPEYTDTFESGLHLIEVSGYDEDEDCSLSSYCFVEVNMVTECEKPGLEISFDLMADTVSTFDPGDVVDTVADVAVTVDISHTWISDLTVSVANPDGVTTTLQAAAGGDADDIQAYYHDLGAVQGTVEYTCSCYIAPAGPGTSADLIGEDSGDWSLTVSDAIIGDDGTLNTWCLRFFGLPPGPTFIRGDCDGLGGFSALLDALFGLNFAFNSGAEPDCLAACDADGNGTISYLVDGLYSLEYAFLSGPAPAAPFPSCGPETVFPNDGCLEQPDSCP